MKLIEIIPCLKTFEEAKRLAHIELPNIEFDSIELYMKNEINIESEIFFFDREEIPEDIIIEINGVQYDSFFSLYRLQEIVEANESLSDLAIAKRIIDYIVYDA